jgi:hypothetical protein
MNMCRQFLPGNVRSNTRKIPAGDKRKSIEITSSTLKASTPFDVPQDNAAPAKDRDRMVE